MSKSQKGCWKNEESRGETFIGLGVNADYLKKARYH